MNVPQMIAVVAVLGISAGLGYSLYEKQVLQQAADNNATAAFNQSESLNRLPDFSYADLQGNTRSSQEWSDKVVVLNFWATWCPPCKKEIPDFIATQQAYQEDVQFVGIAIDDKELVEDFANQYGINYPTLLGDMQAIEISRQLGNRFSGLPYTAIFDAAGKLQYQHTGELTRADLEKQLKALL